MPITNIDDIDFEEVIKHLDYKAEHGQVADALAICRYDIDYKLVDDVGILVDIELLISTPKSTNFDIRRIIICRTDYGPKSKENLAEMRGFLLY